MITKSTGYQSSDGKFHPTLTEAQQQEIILLLNDRDSKNGTRAVGWSVEEIAGELVGQSTKIIDILTMKPNSLPKARKINGGTKKRAPKHIAEQTKMFTEPPAAPAA